jgi:MFS family permease
MFMALLLDYFPIKGYRTKYYLWMNCIGLVLSYLAMMIFGLHIWSYLLFGFLINFFISLNDICCDTTMVVYERKYNMSGKGVSVQWIALAMVGLFTSLMGSKLAESMNYVLAYGICLILPLMFIFYLKFLHTEDIYKKKKFDFKSLSCHFKNKSFLMGLFFIACLQLSPSFGLGLMAEMRETMGVSKIFVGVLGSVGTIFGLVGYILFFKFGNKFDLKKLLIFSIIFSAITNLAYLYIPTQWHIMIYSIIFGAFSGVSFMAIMTFMTRIVPKGNEGVLYACVTALSNFCARGSGILSGMIYDNLGYNWCVILSSLFTIACLFIIPKLKLDKV